MELPLFAAFCLGPWHQGLSWKPQSLESEFTYLQLELISRNFEAHAFLLMETTVRFQVYFIFELVTPENNRELARNHYLAL